MHVKSYLGVVLVGAACAGLLSSGCASKSKPRGKAAPEIAGEDIDGNPMKLSDFRGKVVFLDFWGNW